MRLAPEAHKTIESFLCEYLRLEAPVLPELIIYRGVVASWLTGALRIQGLTFGRRIFISPVSFTRDPDARLQIPAALLVHEAVHTLQYRRRGYTRFLISYLAGYGRALYEQRSFSRRARLAAYFAIPEEREAHRAERTYLEQSLERPTTADRLPAEQQRLDFELSASTLLDPFRE